MTDDSVERLPDDLQQLWDAERRRPSISAERHARLLGRIEVSAGLVASDGVGTAPSRLNRGSRWSTPAKWVATFVAGVGTGAVGGVAATRHLQSHDAHSIVVASQHAPQPTPPSMPPAAIAQSTPGSHVRPAVDPGSASPVIATHAPVARHVSDDRDHTLTDERTVLETARAAVARGDGQAATAALVRHEHEFPHGSLLEERESLWVAALALEHRNEDAVARARSFRLRHPDSIFLSSVNAVAAALEPREHDAAP